MTLRKRNGIWHIDLSVEGMPRYRDSTHTRDERIALAKHADVERALRLGLDLSTGKRSGLTLGMLFDRANRQHWKGQRGHQTVRQHQAAILRHVPATTPLSALEPRLDGLVEALHAGRSPATVNRVLQTLRKALDLAVAWQELDRAPALPRFTEPEGRIRVYSPAEEQAICQFQDAHAPEMARLTRIIFSTGFRLSETLRRDSITLGEGMVGVANTKSSGPGRTLPISPATHSLLVAWLDGPEWTKDQVEWRWRQMRKALGLSPDSVIHAIRHTVCTRLIRGEMQIAKVMLWMGHRDIQTTMRYTHLDASDLTAGVALLDAPVSDSVTEGVPFL